MNENQKRIAAWGAGINVGNSLDAIGGETAWNNPPVTRALIHAYASSGFKILRIPVTWYGHIGPAPDYRIAPEWMARVREVVTWAMEENLRVILNTHHEQGQWLHIELMTLKDVMPVFVAVWKQIAEAFKDFSERLIFQGMNEPRLEGIPTEWEGGNEDVRQSINAFNYAFISTVRESGGNNLTRDLCITTVGAKPFESSLRSMLVPKDEHLILTLHSYLPDSFVAMPQDGGYLYHYDHTVGKVLDRVFDIIERFAIPLGLPVMITEYGAVVKPDPVSGERNDAEVAIFTENFLKRAKSLGIPCVWWDNGYFDSGDQYFGLFDRKNTHCMHPAVVDAIIKNT